MVNREEHTAEPERSMFDRPLAASHLANSDTPFVHWELPLRRVSLEYSTHVRQGKEERYYKLTEMAYRDEAYLDAKAFIFFADNGQLAGVLVSEIKTDSSGRIVNQEEFVSAMDFQVDQGLTTPVSQDEIQLDRLLESGLDNPTLSDRPLRGIDD